VNFIRATFLLLRIHLERLIVKIVARCLGWLVRELMKVGINSLGIDAVPKLIEYAQKEGEAFIV
ncbi:MAG: hypothetical protein KAT04_15375, partial [Methylococcales bacterium]|nr:hypothetical protein [Methylococcales bacterium]